MARQKWASRTTFILASIGSAVGLGNAWRFPGLAAVHGGGAFLLVYFLAMIVLGAPLLMMEISIGRRLRQGSIGSMRSINKKFEFIGWAATSSAFYIVVYYAVVFAWVLLMVFKSFSFAGMTGDTVAASNLWADTIQNSWAITGDFHIPGILIVMLLLAWGLMYYCIRDGAQSVGKVVKFTVFAPVILLLILAIKGVTMPGAMDGLRKLFIPDFAALADASLWIDAFGQVFYSLSIMMSIMFAYGSYLDDKSNIAVDTLIIAASDLIVSVLSAIVLFATMGGVGMLDKMTPSGIATAFIVYPQAIVSLTNIGWLNAAFGVIFYLMLVTLAIDSAFSIVEGVSTAVADRFGFSHKKATLVTCIVAAIPSVLFITRDGMAWLDIVDNWANMYNLILVGVLETIAIGWIFKPSKVLTEINKNTKKFQMPSWWFTTSIKIAPFLLSALFIWNMVIYFSTRDETGALIGYSGYPMWAQIAAGWAFTALIFGSGFIAKLFTKKRDKELAASGKEITWENADDLTD